MKTTCEYYSTMQLKGLPQFLSHDRKTAKKNQFAQNPTQEDEWRQLLLTAIETDSTLDLLGYVVLTLYMGLRPESEVKRIS